MSAIATKGVATASSGLEAVLQVKPLLVESLPVAATQTAKREVPRRRRDNQARVPARAEIRGRLIEVSEREGSIAAPEARLGHRSPGLSASARL